MTSIQRIKISFSCSFFLVSCAAATIGNQRLTYCLAMSAFLQAVRRTQTPVWVRHVVVPGLTDSDEHMKALQAYIRDVVPNVTKVELLPYHKLGENKYRTMGIPYPLEGTPAMDRKQVEKLQKTYFDV